MQVIRTFCDACGKEIKGRPWRFPKYKEEPYDCEGGE